MEKFKKIIPVILIVIFIGWFCKKYFIDREVPRSQTQELNRYDLEAHDELDEEGEDSDALDGHAHGVNETKEEKMLKELTDEEAEEIIGKIEKIEQKWLDQVHTIVGDQNFEQYLKMRQRNEKEKLDAYNQYHEFLRKKYGDKYAYNISEDQSKKEKEINQNFLKEFKMLIGESKFKDYLKAKDEINKEYQKQNELFMEIEF